MHWSKYSQVQAYNILQHNEPNRVRSNRDNVNPELTKNNYNLLKTKNTGFENLKNILNEPNVHRMKRKDLNVLCSCVITLPKEAQGREKEFFYYSAKFLQARYKDARFLSAWVHNDEGKYITNINSSTGRAEKVWQKGRPHIHIDICPVEQVNGQYKICAKDLINRKDLTTLHGDFEKYICQQMGLKLEILNGATAGGNRSIMELKKQSLENEVIRLEKLKMRIQTEIQQEICR